MPRFEVTYRNEQGALATILLEADSDDAALKLARLRGLWAEAAVPVADTEVATEGGGSWWPRGSVPRTEIYHFTRFFATLVRAGVPIVETLQLLAGRARHPRLQAALTDIVNAVRSGQRLGVAFAAHADVFDTTYQNLIKIGEESGEFYRVLERLMQLLSRQIRLRRNIRKALTYPCLVLALSSVITWALLRFVVPRFTSVYARFGGELPGLTKITIAISAVVVQHGLLLIGTLVLLGLLGALALRTTTGRALADRVLLSLPLIGPMLHTYEIASFAKDFSTLIHSGITVVTGLGIAVPAVGRVPIRDVLERATEEIRQGRTMGESFAAGEPWLPDLFTHMIVVGERTGNLTEMLEHVADFYEEEFDDAVETLSSLIEPIMIVFLGVVIGTIVLSLYLPIFGLARIIARR